MPKLNELPEIRLFCVIQAFANMCYKPLQILDAAKDLDPNYLDAFEAGLLQLADKIDSIRCEIGNNPKRTPTEAANVVQMGQLVAFIREKIKK